MDGAPSVDEEDKELLAEAALNASSVVVVVVGDGEDDLGGVRENNTCRGRTDVGDAKKEPGDPRQAAPVEEELVEKHLMCTPVPSAGRMPRARDDALVHAVAGNARRTPLEMPTRA